MLSEHHMGTWHQCVDLQYLINTSSKALKMYIDYFRLELGSSSHTFKGKIYILNNWNNIMNVHFVSQYL